MSDVKNWCSQWDCDPKLTGIGAWCIKVCGTCKRELSETLYESELKRQKEKPAPDWGTDLDNYD